MSLLDGFISTYALLFDLDMWIEVLSDPVSWGLIGTLLLMEGLLSADNAIVLAVMVKHLPEKQRKRALFYGLLGAYVFRFIAIGIGVILIKLWWIKILGALYLGWLAVKFFMDKRKEKVGLSKDGTDDNLKYSIKKDGLIYRVFGIFWGTIIMVEIMDIAFSVDSVLAAFAISEQVWVLLLGGMFGILMMRGIAGLFLKLIDHVPEIESTAYYLILFVSFKMLLSVIHIDIPNFVFFLIVVLLFTLTFLLHYKNKVINKNKLIK